MDNEKKLSFTRRISQANSTEMVVIIYDIALAYIEDAKAALQGAEKNVDAFHSAVGSLQGCMSELGNSLNMEYELAGNLRQLYNYCLRVIGASEARLDADGLTEVEKVLKPLRDAYDQISGENKNGPVMGNSQSVFAGLTYGKEELIESLSTNTNRGYLA